MHLGLGFILLPQALSANYSDTMFNLRSAFTFYLTPLFFIAFESLVHSTARTRICQ